MRIRVRVLPMSMSMSVVSASPSTIGTVCITSIISISRTEAHTPTDQGPSLSTALTKHLLSCCCIRSGVLAAVVHPFCAAHREADQIWKIAPAPLPSASTHPSTPCRQQAVRTSQPVSVSVSVTVTVTVSVSEHS